MSLIKKILQESSENLPKKNLFFHGGNLDYFDKNEIEVPKKGRFEYGIGLYLSTSREVADKYSKGSRKLYLVELEDNITNLDDVKVNTIEIFEHFKTILSKSDLLKLKNFFDKKGKEEYSLGVINNILINYDILKPKYAKFVAEFFISKGADYAEANTFGFKGLTIVLFNYSKIKNIKNISKRDENYFEI